MKITVGNTTRAGYGPRPVPPVWERRALSPSRLAVLEAVQDAAEPATLSVLSTATGLHVNTLREHLDVLVARGLVRRTRSAPQGRGRPAWLYDIPPAAPPSSQPPASDYEYAGLAATLAAHIHHTSTDPVADAVAAGKLWGRDLARRNGPPAERGSAGTRRHIAKMLEDLGFAPELDPQATTARLTRCPLLETAKEFPDVVCGVHLGIVRGALEEYGADPERTGLEAFSEPGACRLDLLTPKARR